MASRRATTTAVVRDLPALDRRSYDETLRMSLTDGGWPGEWEEDLVEDVIDLVEDWPEGTVMERSIDLVRPRFDPATGALRPPIRVGRAR